MQAQIDQLRADVDAIQVAYDQLQAIIAAKDAEITSLTLQLSAANSNATAWAAAYANLNTAIDQAQAATVHP